MYGQMSSVFKMLNVNRLVNCSFRISLYLIVLNWKINAIFIENSQAWIYNKWTKMVSVFVVIWKYWRKKKVLFQKFVFNFITTRFFKLYFGFSCLFENTERKLVFVNNIFHFYYDDVWTNCWFRFMVFVNF